MCDEIVPQTLYREISVDNAHQHTDEEQKYENFNCIIKEEIYGNSYRSIGTQSEQPVNKPVSKILYHFYSILIRLNTNNLFIKRAADSTTVVSAAHS